MKYFNYFLIIVVWSCAGSTKVADDYFEQEAYAEAIVSYSDHLSGHGPTIAVLYNRGRSFEEIGEYEKALNDFQKILELDKKNIKAQTSIAKVKYESGDFEQAVLAAQKAIKWGPDFAQSHFWLAKGAHQMGYFEDALKSYGNAIKLNPDYGDAF